MPEFFDQDELDVVELTVSLTDSMKEWVRYDEIYRQFIVKPTQNSQLGLTRIEITLDDSKSTSVYYLNLWIVEITEIQDSTEPEPYSDRDPDSID